MADDPTQPATPPVAAAPASAGPWQQDIELVFSDPQVRATVDSFMRSKVQPRMTQYEQQIAAAKDAQDLWSAFQEDPTGTYASVTKQLYGDDVAQAALDALEQRLNAPPEPAPVEPGQQSINDPRFEETYNYIQQQKAREQEAVELAAYDAQVGQILADPANADINEQRYHQFVAAADGNFEQAIQMYREDAAQARIEAMNSLGLTPEQIAELTANAPPPPVMGSEVAGASAPPPTEPQYQGQEGLHRAIEDAAAISRAKSQAPPIS